MKASPSLSNPSEAAAIRIQYWFGKDKQVLLGLNSSVPKAQEFPRKHQCRFLKPPRIVSQVDHLSGHTVPKKNKNARVRQVSQENHFKPLGITVNQPHSIHKKDLSYFQLENTLSPERVVRCRHKEHFLVSKRLKNLSKQGSSGPKRHLVVRIKSSSQEELSKNPYLEEWDKFKEERHFQMGHVTRPPAKPN